MTTSTHDAGAQPWLIALDLDGTTVDQEGIASERVRAAVAQAQRAGHHVMIATGRPILGALPVYRMLHLNGGFAVCSNGAVTIAIDDTRAEGYRIVSEHTFDPSPVLDLIAPAMPGASYAVEDGADGYRFDRMFTAGTFGSKTELVSYEDLKSRPVTRLIVVARDLENAEFLRRVEAIGLHQVSYSVGWSNWLDIAPGGVNKSTGLEFVRSRLGVPSERVLVIGDGLNDIEMLEWAVAGGGIGAAMGHAPEELRRVANRVVGDFEHHGVAEAIGLVLGSARPEASPFR